MDPFQEQGIQFIDQKKSLIVSAPTGSGKTLLAEYAIETALKANQEVIYTAPIKALSNQKFRDFTLAYGREKVGIMTGDVSYNNEAPILIMTTEIFRNAIFEDPERFRNVLYLILDEVHYLDDAERGSVWEESLIFAPFHIKVLCLSATVPNVIEIAQWMSRIRGETIEVIQESKRPVPLHEMCCMDNNRFVPLVEAYRALPKKIKQTSHNYTTEIKTRALYMQALDDTLYFMRTKKQYPCLYFVFSRKECELNALHCQKYQFLNEQDQAKVKARLTQLLAIYRLDKALLQEEPCTLLMRGIGYHHAGMIPALKEMVEQLFTEGMVKLLFATETFALGINMPARSVVFHALKKFDGIEVRRLTALEYQQMAGRAGRRGIDSVGYVYTNLVMDQIAQGELSKIVKGPLEEISSQFNLSYSTLLNLYERLGKEIIHACEKSLGSFHESMLLEKLGGKQRRKQFQEEQQRMVKKKLSLLQTLGYLKGEKLTSKGRFAVFVNGYEIQLTELFFDGFFENQNEITLFMILVALVFEGKKNLGRRKPRLPKDIEKLEKEVNKRIQTAQSMESLMGIKGEIKLPDFSLSPIAQGWASGQSFTQLLQHTDISAGDIIRTFRQSIQMCRQLHKACQGYSSFTTLIDRCLMATNRDEVNALAQLRAFAALNTNKKQEAKPQ